MTGSTLDVEARPHEDNFLKNIRQYLNKMGEFLKVCGIEVQLVAPALIQIASPKGTGNGTACLN